MRSPLVMLLRECGVEPTLDDYLSYTAAVLENLHRIARVLTP